MANYDTDTTMGLLIPIPGVDPGEEYAYLISNDLARIANHTHTGPSNLDGYQVPTAGLNINEDLSTQSNNITNLRSTRYIDQPSSLVGVGDLDCVYFQNGDLWINNGDGVPIQITSGGLVNTTSSNNYNVLDISSNHAINFTDTDILFSVDCRSNTVSVTLPLAADVPNGRFYFLKDTYGASETFAITLVANGTDTVDGDATYVIHDNYASFCVVKDTSTSWVLFLDDKKVYDKPTDIKFNDDSSLMFVQNGAINFEGPGIISMDDPDSLITLTDGGEISLSSNSETSNIRLTSAGNIINPGYSLLTGIIGMDNVVVTTTPYSIIERPIDGGKGIILVNTATLAITLNLPSCADVPGMFLVIKDMSGNATYKNITVTPHTTDLIEGLNKVILIPTNYGSLTLFCDADNSNWVII